MNQQKLATPQVDRIPPQNLDIEQLLIGSILLNHQCMDAIAPILIPEHFYNPTHSAIYQAAYDLFRSLRPVDTVSISTWLEEHKLLSKIGGRETLTKIQDCTPYDVDAEGYAKEIRRYHLHRETIEAGHKLIELGYDTSKELPEVLRDSEQAVFAVTQQYSDSKGWRSPADLVGDVAQRIIDRMESRCAVGIPTGFYDLDAMLQGLKGGQAVYVIGRPGMAKTSFALQIAHFVAKVPLHLTAAFFSLEMSHDELMIRMLSGEISVESGRLNSGRLLPAEVEELGLAMSRVGAIANLKIDDTPGLSIDDIASRCRKLQSETGDLGVVFIDHLHMLGYDPRDEVGELSRITKTVKALAKELNVPIVVLAQLNRGVEGRAEKRPLMSDIRGCGTAEQDADIIIGLYRDEYYNSESPDRGLAEVIILKNRGGPVGTIKLLFEACYTRFKNLANSRNSDIHQPPTPPERSHLQLVQRPEEQRDRELANAFTDEDLYGEPF